MILVTDSQLRQSLAIIRSLGQKGLKILAGDKERISTGFFSKYTTQRIVYPDPAENEEAFLSFIFDLVKKEKIEMIIPVRDETLILLAKNKELLTPYTILPIADLQTILQARDKGSSLKIAQQIGLPIPQTIFPDEQTDLNQIKEYPVLLKPRLSSGSRGLALCQNAQELLKKFKENSKIYGPLLIQEYIAQGEEIGYYALLDQNSQLVALTVQKRIRSYPVSGGPSTLRQTIHHPQIEKLGLKILQALKWQGVAMVEFKIDSRDGRPKLMEINPRFWGSLALSIAAGVDFPFLLYQLYSGRGARRIALSPNKKYPLVQYQTGVQCRWLLPGDILWFLSSRKTWSNLKAFFKFRGYHYDIISKDDWLPMLGFFLASLTYLFSLKKLKYVFRKKL